MRMADRRVPAHDGRRFKAVKVDPSRVRPLDQDHPALVEGRTLFPGTVVEPLASPRILVSGSNSPKLGVRVRKGPWAGMPIYQVTLEERRTCPPSCPVLDSCYGDAMHLARRHDALHEDFMVALWAETVSTYRAVMNAKDAPPGIVVRLHVLGDFFSAQYVALWADLLDKLPRLHVFGYTARREDADDENSRATARAVRELAEAQWDRFAIRFSRARAVPQGAVVVNTIRAATDAGAIVCPAQTEATASCATCGLCWAPAFQRSTIAFLRHGRTFAGARTSGPARPLRQYVPRVQDVEPIDTDWDGDPGVPGSPEWWAQHGL